MGVLVGAASALPGDVIEPDFGFARAVFTPDECDAIRRLMVERATRQEDHRPDHGVSRVNFGDVDGWLARDADFRWVLRRLLSRLDPAPPPPASGGGSGGARARGAWGFERPPADAAAATTDDALVDALAANVGFSLMHDFGPGGVLLLLLSSSLTRAVELRFFVRLRRRLLLTARHSCDAPTLSHSPTTRAIAIVTIARPGRLLRLARRHGAARRHRPHAQRERAALAAGRVRRRPAAGRRAQRERGAGRRVLLPGEPPAQGVCAGTHQRACVRNEHPGTRGGISAGVRV